MSLKQAINRLARDDGGQAITEYVLLLSVTLVSAVGLARAMIGILDKVTLTFGGQLEKDLKTGRASVSVFNN